MAGCGRVPRSKILGSVAAKPWSVGGELHYRPREQRRGMEMVRERGFAGPDRLMLRRCDLPVVVCRYSRYFDINYDATTGCL